MEDNSTDDLGVYFLWEDIELESCKKCAQWIIKENSITGSDKNKVLTIIINSNGGSVHAGLALINIMEGSAIPINTVILGLSASMGLMISMAGKHRIISPSAQILSHAYSDGDAGSYHALVASRKYQDELYNITLEHYKKYTKLNENQIKKTLLNASDNWLTPQQALELNLVDEIKEFGV